MVMGYHGGLPGLAVGGFYGVDIFFVLSGFLITSILLDDEASRPGRLRLGRFWGRRAVRLLPALLVLLAATAAYVTWWAPRGLYPGFRDDALSVLGYFSNWRFVLSSSDYFASTGDPSLLTHTWSLAIEEQFYLLWPLALLAITRLARRRGAGPAAAVAGLAATGTVASTVWQAVLYHRGAAPSRLYYGTDTHASALLCGATLAAVAAGLARRPDAGRASTGRRYGWWPAAAFGAGAATLAVAATTMGSEDAFAYQGGFLAVALAATAVVAALHASPGGRPARLLALPPVAYLGRISYGMYLWYFPIFAVLDRGRTGLTGTALFVLRAAADVVVASASFHLLEWPLRRRLRAPAGLSRARAGAALGATTALLAGGLALVVPAAPAAGLTPSALTEVAGHTHGATRVLIAGDSTGLTLGLGLAVPSVAGPYGLSVASAAVLGCGVVDSYAVLDHGRAVVPPAPCDLTVPVARRWPAGLAGRITAFHPDVVVLASGRWETKDQRLSPGGPWVSILQPAGAAAVQAGLEAAVTTARTEGARILLATAPCFSTGEQPDGRSWPEDDPARVAAYDALVRQVAAGRTGVGVLDLGGLVCPAGRFTTTIGGVTVRAPDGIHYPFFSLSDPGAEAPDTEAQTVRFGEWLAARIAGPLRG
jgi:peptidoglycan/LPS O-acetylase OafA/YrhL